MQFTWTLFSRAEKKTPPYSTYSVRVSVVAIQSIYAGPSRVKYYPMACRPASSLLQRKARNQESKSHGSVDVLPLAASAYFAFFEMQSYPRTALPASRRLVSQVIASLALNLFHCILRPCTTSLLWSIMRLLEHLFRHRYDKIMQCTPYIPLIQ